jgi:hypothetical protein
VTWSLPDVALPLLPAVPDPAGGGVGSVFDVAAMLADLDGLTMMGLLLIAMVKGWLVLPRELTNRDARIAELVVERDEYKRLAFSALNVGERVVSVAEQRDLS